MEEPIQECILATANLHKVEELKRLLKGRAIRILSAATCGGMPPVDENADSFAGNAELKARALRALAPEQAWVLADDSGLEVDALNGAPGIHSARFAGPEASDGENLEKLLKALLGVPAEKRTARFCCVLCRIDGAGTIRYYEGICAGRIAEQASGEGGFGYDPVFIPEGFEQSFAELGESVKNQHSHRARAVAAFCEALPVKI